jgi:hypothetical protein
MSGSSITSSSSWRKFSKAASDKASFKQRITRTRTYWALSIEKVGAFEVKEAFP